MNWKKATLFFMIFGTIVILGYDGIAIWQGGVQASISAETTSYAHKYPMLPFIWGVLIGHFFA